MIGNLNGHWSTNLHYVHDDYHQIENDEKTFRSWWDWQDARVCDVEFIYLFINLGKLNQIKIFRSWRDQWERQKARMCHVELPREQDNATAGAFFLPMHWTIIIVIVNFLKITMVGTSISNIHSDEVKILRCYFRTRATPLVSRTTSAQDSHARCFFNVLCDGHQDSWYIKMESQTSRTTHTQLGDKQKALEVDFDSET